MRIQLSLYILALWLLYMFASWLHLSVQEFNKYDVNCLEIINRHEGHAVVDNRIDEGHFYDCLFHNIRDW